MKENIQEKSLKQISEGSIFYRIKRFLKKIFIKNIESSNAHVTVKEKIPTESKEKKSSFMEYIKNIEDEETKLLKLQKQYRSGEIKEEELSQEQVESLCDLYDRQIANLKKSNEKRKQKLAEYRRKLQTDN